MKKLFLKKGFSGKRVEEVPFVVEGIVVKSEGESIGLPTCMDRIILRIGSQKKEFFLVTGFRISIGEKIRLYHRGTDADDVWGSPGDGDLPHSGICVDAFEVLGANNEVVFQAVLNFDAYFKET